MKLATIFAIHKFIIRMNWHNKMNFIAIIPTFSNVSPIHALPSEVWKFGKRGEKTACIQV